MDTSGRGFARAPLTSFPTPLPVVVRSNTTDSGGSSGVRLADIGDSLPGGAFAGSENGRKCAAAHAGGAIVLRALRVSEPSTGALDAGHIFASYARGLSAVRS